jgi:predicted dehydrogenase
MSKVRRLGIIGAENSHSFKIAEICNIREAVPLRVTHLWGETKDAADDSAAKGRIPHIISDWRSLLGKVDGVMIDHRHGGAHAEAARYFIDAGLPTFVDKPITCDLAQAQELFDMAEKKSCPIITFSSKPLQKVFQAKLKAIGRDAVRVFNSSGPSDLESRHGGVFFYGIHQVDCAVEALGTDAVSVFLHRSGPNAIATIEFSGGRLATLNLISTHPAGFHWRFCTDHGDFSLADKNDTIPYLNTARLVSNFLKSGETPFSRRRMLAPIAILEAIQASYTSGTKMAVKSF